MCEGRLWQSTQSMRRIVPAAAWSGLRGRSVDTYSVAVPSGPVTRTQGITSRASSAAMYSISFLMFMCQWMPLAAPTPGSPPPIFSSIWICHRLLASSASTWLKVFCWAPKNFAGQWHCSQVSCAGRRLATGVGIGRGNRLVVTAYTWYRPLSFDRTNHPAPGPT